MARLEKDDGGLLQKTSVGFATVEGRSAIERHEG